ncbi:MAG TPA: hypothetical protein VGE13_02765 [Candidatus Saccharimonadales bacterium]
MSAEKQTLSKLHNAYVYTNEGVPVLVSDLTYRVHNSDYGLYMDSQDLRFWENFGYHRPTMLADLGSDLHPIGHQNETARHLSLVIENEPDLCLSPEEIGTLALASRMHDMGESMHPRIAERTGAVVGDIPAGKKTDNQRLIEMRVRRYVYDQLLPDVHQDIIDRVELIIAHHDETILHELFEVAHELQTFDTAKRAKSKWEEGIFHHHGQVMHIQSDDGGRTSGLLGLHRAVFMRSGITLLKSYSHYNHVQSVLEPYLGELERYVAYRDNQAA